jgi:hypothetical protein
MKIVADMYLNGLESTESKTIPASLKNISKILKEKVLKKIIENGFVAMKMARAVKQNPKVAFTSFFDRKIKRNMGREIRAVNFVPMAAPNNSPANTVFLSSKFLLFDKYKNRKDTLSKAHKIRSALT